MFSRKRRPRTLPELEASRDQEWRVFGASLRGFAGENAEDLWNSTVSDALQLSSVDGDSRKAELASRRELYSRIDRGGGHALLAVPNPPRHFFARAQELSTLAEALSRAESAIVTGPAGVGKSSLCFAAVHTSEVQARYGTNVLRADCEGSASGALVLNALIRLLDVQATGDPLSEICRYCDDLGDSLVFLDGLEHAWRADWKRVEEILRTLSAHSTLLVSMATAVSPPQIEAIRIDLKPLTAEEAVGLFRRLLPGAAEVPDDVLLGIATPTACMPLGVEALAIVAGNARNLEGYLREVQREPEQLISLSDRLRDRYTAAVGSLEPALRTALVLLALCPDGLTEEELHALGIRQIAVDQILAAHLATEFSYAGPQRLETRVSALPPIRRVLRDGVSGDHEVTAALGPLTALLVERARDLEARTTTAVDRREQPALLTLRWDLQNYLSVLPRGLAAGLCAVDVYVEAASAVSRWALRFGIDVSSDLLEPLQREREWSELPHVRMWLGDEALLRKDFAIATSEFDAAARTVGRGTLTHANALKRAADVAFNDSRLDDAKKGYDDAIDEYRELNSSQGLATSLMHLAELAIRRSQINVGMAHVADAKRHFMDSGDELGVANCDFLSAEALLQGFDVLGARRILAEARIAYSTLGLGAGTMNCDIRECDFLLSDLDTRAAERVLGRVADGIGTQLHQLLRGHLEDCRARLSALRGDRDDFVSSSSDATAAFEHSGDGLGASWCRLLRIVWSMACGEREIAKSQFAIEVDMFGVHHEVDRKLSIVFSAVAQELTQRALVATPARADSANEGRWLLRLTDSFAGADDDGAGPAVQAFLAIPPSRSFSLSSRLPVDT